MCEEDVCVGGGEGGRRGGGGRGWARGWVGGWVEQPHGGAGIRPKTSRVVRKQSCSLTGVPKIVLKPTQSNPQKLMNCPPRQGPPATLACLVPSRQHERLPRPCFPPRILPAARGGAVGQTRGGPFRLLSGGDVTIAGGPQSRYLDS